MIILPEYKLIIVTPPKCGSTSLHQYFCENKRSGILCIDRDHDKHTCHVPFHYRMYDVVVVIRNPRDRFFSLFNHYNRWHKETLSYQQFYEQYTRFEPFYAWRIVDYLQNYDLVTSNFIKIEEINNNLSLLLGHDVNIPKLHISDVTQPQDLIIPHTCMEFEDEYS